MATTSNFSLYKATRRGQASADNYNDNMDSIDENLYDNQTNIATNVTDIDNLENIAEDRIPDESGVRNYGSHDYPMASGFYGYYVAPSGKAIIFVLGCSGNLLGGADYGIGVVDCSGNQIAALTPSGDLFLEGAVYENTAFGGLWPWSPGWDTRL